MPLDPKRPLKTVDGRAVKILSTDGPDPNHPLVGVVPGDLLIHQWSVLGEHATALLTNRLNLVQERQKTTVYLYRGDSGIIYATIKPDKYKGLRGYTLVGSAEIEHD